MHGKKKSEYVSYVFPDITTNEGGVRLKFRSV